MNAGAEAIIGNKISDGSSLTGDERVQNMMFAVSGATGTLAGGLGMFRALRSAPVNMEKPVFFDDQMLPTEAVRYRAYWHDAKLKLTTPGVRTLERIQVSADGKYTYRAISYFDEFGRLRAEAHFTTHPSTGVTHPNPHYHLRDLFNRKLALMPGEYLGE